MLEGIATSDWHLEGLKKHFPDDHVDRQLAEIDKIYQYAIENGIEHIFVPGDITNSYKMEDTTKTKLLQHLVKYEGEIDTWYTGGNHDWADETQTSMDLISNFCEWKFLKSFHVILKPTQIDIDGVTVNFLPHPARTAIKHKKGKGCLNFCHVEVAGAFGDNGRPLKTESKIKVGKKDFTISGHIHLHQYLKKIALLFCGSPYQKTFGESLPKGFVHFKAKYKKDGTLEVKFQFIDLKPDFRLETVLIEEQSQWSYLEANPSIRYRVYYTEDIIVPEDIRQRVPNISQLLSTSKGVKASDLDLVDIGQEDIEAIDPQRGLDEYLKQAGLSKKHIRLARKEFESALSSISM